MPRPATSATLAHVVAFLNDGEVHSGTEIASALGLSRTAVWKALQRLQDYGVPLATQHLGYQLMSPLILLENAKITALLDREDIALNVVESLASTNDYLKQKPISLLPHFCLAEHQSNGRGRLGRSWASPFGKNLYMSLSSSLMHNVNEIASISLVIGLCIAKTLESLYPTVHPTLKWPNDIYAQGKKMGGILVDIAAEAYGTSKVVIGIGLNVNMKSQIAPEIQQPWISLEHLLGAPQDRNVLSAHLISAILDGLELFREKGFAFFRADWERYDCLRDEVIVIQDGAEPKQGIARGIDEHGYLRLETPSGHIELISCGDTSLRWRGTHG